MRRLVAFGFACWVALAAQATSAAPRAFPPISESIVTVVVLKTNGGAEGTGVMTTRGLLTCAHVTDGAVAVYVRDKKGREWHATSWAPLDAADAAVVRFKEVLPLPQLPVGALPRKRHVRCVGSWGKARDEGFLVDVHCTAWPSSENYNGARGWIDSSAPLAMGMSGSPMLDGRTVVGLAAMKCDTADVTVFSALPAGGG